MIDVERWAWEREDRWRRLAELLDVADRAPERELGPAGMRELLRLYRLVSSDLNRARSLTANPDLLGRRHPGGRDPAALLQRRPAGCDRSELCAGRRGPLLLRLGGSARSLRDRRHRLCRRRRNGGRARPAAAGRAVARRRGAPRLPA